MNEITGIEIQDFQSHKHTVLEPAPAGQLTVIVGPSDSGKTAIIRALRWLFYNVPQGADFIRIGGNAARVTINYADGQRVTRARSRKGFNRYEDGNSRYEGFGNAVPLEVQEITGVRPVQIGDMEFCLNLAEQLDGPFLGKSVSAPAKAKVLGKLAGTEEVDYAAKGVGTDIYRARQEEKRLSDEVIRLQEAIKEYDYLEELGKWIEDAQAVLTRIKANTDMLNALQRLQKQQNTVKNALWESEVQLNSLSAMLHLTEAGLRKAEEQVERHARLRSLFDKWSKNAVDLAIEKATLDRTEHIGEAELLLTCVTKRLERLTLFRNTKERFMDIDYEVDEIAWFLTATRTVDAAYQSIEVLQNNITTLRALRSVSKRLQQCIQDIGMHGQRLEKLVNIDNAANIISKITQKKETSKNLYLLNISLVSCKSLLRKTEESIIANSAEEQRLANDYRNTLLAAGVCPMCGSKITSNILREAI